MCGSFELKTRFEDLPNALKNDYPISLKNQYETQNLIRPLNPVLVIKNEGRMLIRKSGTEPKIRIMGESKNIALLKKCINIVKRSIK